ncbi:hypothetical protein [Sutcliffiella deserti]|uniref:hypothetical protein n=1 Tax=Sutcliffiella deserti TaxID=2875501 RepID=UPI001CBEA5CC|nr:hypothetical protein [Sutcliffiella deserti]
MMKTKATVALSIFSTLFAGAWWFNAEQKSDFDDRVNSTDSQIMLIGTNHLDNQGSFQSFQPFKPREYIRVVVVKDEEQEVEPT